MRATPFGRNRLLSSGPVLSRPMLVPSLIKDCSFLQLASFRA
jgi:hypothetical protein